MAAFLAVVAIVAVLLHEQAAHFFMRNPPLNTLILAVLGLGVALSFRTVLILEPEVAWIEIRRRDGRAITPEARATLLHPLRLLLDAPPGRASLTMTTLRNVLDGIDSRLDERRDTSRYLIALLIFLGLLGTFWGLLLTANSVGETIRGLNVEGSDPAQMFGTLRAGLEAPLAGMGTAFSTSLFGLASSLVLGFLDLQASQAQNRFANELEVWLAESPQLGADLGHDGGAAAPAYLTALLQQAAENFDKLERRMTRAADEGDRLQATLRELGERFGELTAALRARGEPTDGAHLRSFEVAVARLTDEASRGRERAVDEIRDEIRLLARTLSAIADRER
ncbi:MAG: flagellar motor protein MotA [Candidatus Binatia bacterium]